VRALNASGFACSLRSFSAIGSREICASLQGKFPLDEAVRKTRQATRRFARRQLAWFRAEPTVTWYKSAAEVLP
jgi:tRNA dimethylallyltransferase